MIVPHCCHFSLLSLIFFLDDIPADLTILGFRPYWSGTSTFLKMVLFVVKKILLLRNTTTNGLYENFIAKSQIKYKHSLV